MSTIWKARKLNNILARKDLNILEKYIQQVYVKMLLPVVKLGLSLCNQEGDSDKRI